MLTSLLLLRVTGRRSLLSLLSSSLTLLLLRVPRRLAVRSRVAGLLLLVLGSRRSNPRLRLLLSLRSDLSRSLVGSGVVGVSLERGLGRGLAWSLSLLSLSLGLRGAGSSSEERVDPSSSILRRESLSGELVSGVASEGSGLVVA